MFPETWPSFWLGRTEAKRVTRWRGGCCQKSHLSTQKPTNRQDLFQTQARICHGSKAKMSRNQGAANPLSSACLRRRSFLSWRQFGEGSWHEQERAPLERKQDQRGLSEAWHTFGKWDILAVHNRRKKIILKKLKSKKICPFSPSRKILIVNFILLRPLLISDSGPKPWNNQHLTSLGRQCLKNPLNFVLIQFVLLSSWQTSP